MVVKTYVDYVIGWIFFLATKKKIFATSVSVIEDISVNV